MKACEDSRFEKLLSATELHCSFEAIWSNERITIRVMSLSASLKALAWTMSTPR